jgi:hypothetical protein
MRERTEKLGGRLTMTSQHFDRYSDQSRHTKAFYFYDVARPAHIWKEFEDFKKVASSDTLNRAKRSGYALSCT